MLSLGTKLFGFLTGLGGLVTSWFTFAERQQDIRAGRDQQAAADEHETIAAQQRELRAAADASDAAATEQRLKGGTF